MTATDTTTTEDHAVNPLHRLLVALVDRTPWHSEAQRAEMFDHLRASEAALKGDDADTSASVVPPAPVPLTPASTSVAMDSSGAIDYDKLAQAIVKAQTAQQAQAAAAVEADPTFEPPGSLTAPAGESHAAADAQS